MNIEMRMVEREKALQTDTQRILESLGNAVDAGRDAHGAAILRESSPDKIAEASTGVCAAPLQALNGNSPMDGAPSHTHSFFGTSPAMARIKALLADIGWSDAPVLIQGETGCGKEVLAQEVHAHSRRANRPFSKVNCAALGSELVDSELFGYERGSGTGTFERKPGVLEAVNGGTILLDEIGDLDLRLQAKLLQVLQDHTLYRVGGKEAIQVDVRMVAATHQDLERRIVEGSFREDLYYRLNVLSLLVPPLRERKRDIPALAMFLLKKHAQPDDVVPTITPDLEAAMLEWYWPGNVRELENFIRNLLISRDCDQMARELRECAQRKSYLAPHAGYVGVERRRGDRRRSIGEASSRA